MSTVTATGELIAGKYRITRKLGSGGMADVFLASTEGAAGFARMVVIKRLAPVLARDPEVVAMFLDEARIAARLHHGNIAQVFDFGEDAAGYFLAMEYLAGRDALGLVRAALPDHLPLSAAVTIAMGAAAGLHHAHELRGDDGRPLGIVHRDVTSANVFVTVDGGVKLIDFGIARAADRSTATRTGLVKGTVAYLSPEQIHAVPVDRRSDLFQLGVVLHELVTGARPFDRPGDTDLAIMKRIEAGAFAPPGARRPDCPPDLAALIARLLAVDPAHRLSTGDAVIVELDALARRHGWPTSAYDLARVVRAVTVSEAADPDRGPRDTDVQSTPPVEEAAAILAELEAPPRHTAPIGEAPAGAPTVRAKTPRAAAPAAPTPTAAPAAPASAAPARAKRAAAIAGVAAVLAGAAIATAIGIRGGAPAPASPEAAPDPWAGAPGAATAPADIGAAATNPPEETGPPSVLFDTVLPIACLNSYAEVAATIRHGLDGDVSVRKLRELVEMARGYLACARGYDDEDVVELGELEARVREVEERKGLTFAVTDDDKVSHYRDRSTGADLTTAEVDAR